jgi:hypothetical protein
MGRRIRDDRAVLVEGIAAALVKCVRNVRTGPLSKKDLARELGISVGLVGAWLAKVPDVRKVGSGRRRLYLVPMIEMPIQFQAARGFSSLFALLGAFSRDDGLSGRIGLGKSRLRG